MNEKIKKIESAKRIAELNPSDTLAKLGVEKDSIVFDYCAGTRVFAF